MLDDIAPADSCVVSTETDLSFLGSVRNNAHLSATKIVIEEILEPHAGDEEEIPTIRATLLDIVLASIAADLAVILPG